jgi:hypothetical protein
MLDCLQAFIQISGRNIFQYNFRCNFNYFTTIYNNYKLLYGLKLQLKVKNLLFILT